MVGLGSLSSTQKRALGVLGGVAGLSALGIGVAVARSRAKKKRKARAQRARKAPYRRTKGQRYTPRTAGKRRDTSRRRIRYTKNGQPYVILASGKARFIKKIGAKRSHRRKGGRY